LWCRGSTRGCEPLGPGPLPGCHPMPVVSDGRSAPCKGAALSRASTVRLGVLAPCFRWRTPPLGFRSPDAPFDSARKHHGADLGGRDLVCKTTVRKRANQARL